MILLSHNRRELQEQLSSRGIPCGNLASNFTKHSDHPHLRIASGTIELRHGAVHEWFPGRKNTETSTSRCPTINALRANTSVQALAPSSLLLPPLCIFIELAHTAILQQTLHAVLWVGAGIWPYPPLLRGRVGRGGESRNERSLLSHSIFIDPPDLASRLWAIEVALRAGAGPVGEGATSDIRSGPVCVIADGRGFTLPHTRRLQLAAAASGSLCILARAGGSEAHIAQPEDSATAECEESAKSPAARGDPHRITRPPAHHRGRGDERQQLSAAATRWVVTPEPTTGTRPCWTVTQIRNKDRPTLTEEASRRRVEWDHAQGLIAVPADVADRSLGTPATLAGSGIRAATG